MTYSTVTLTGTINVLDGTAAQGSITIRPSRTPVTDTDGHVILSGRVDLDLDELGHFEIDLPATDDSGLGEPFTYTVSVALRDTRWAIRGLVLPASLGTFDLAHVPAE